jgi:hypothetical protein
VVCCDEVEAAGGDAISHALTVKYWQGCSTPSFHERNLRVFNTRHLGHQPTTSTHWLLLMKRRLLVGVGVDKSLMILPRHKSSSATAHPCFGYLLLRSTRLECCKGVLA